MEVQSRNESGKKNSMSETEIFEFHHINLLQIKGREYLFLMFVILEHEAVVWWAEARFIRKV